jgi:hypothetical protein
MTVRVSRHLGANLRGYGAVDAALVAVARALAALTRGRCELIKYYFLAQPVPAEAHAHRGGSLRVEPLASDDPRLARLPRAATEIAQRFESGAQCIAAWQNDELTGFLWFTEREYREDAVQCTFILPPDDRTVWDFDVHVEPRFRLGRTFALLWDRAFSSMRARGVRWSLSRVSAFSLESLRAHQRAGAVGTGWAVFARFGSLQFTLTSLGEAKCRWLQHGPYLCLQVPEPPSDLASARSAERSTGRGAMV